MGWNDTGLPTSQSAEDHGLRVAAGKRRNAYIQELGGADCVTAMEYDLADRAAKHFIVADSAWDAGDYALARAESREARATLALLGLRRRARDVGRQPVQLAAPSFGTARAALLAQMAGNGSLAAAGDGLAAALAAPPADDPTVAATTMAPAAATPAAAPPARADQRAEAGQPGADTSVTHPVCSSGDPPNA